MNTQVLQHLKPVVNILDTGNMEETSGFHGQSYKAWPQGYSGH